MAITTITPLSLARNAAGVMPTMAAVGSVTEGASTKYLAKVPFNGKEDARILILLENADGSNTEKATIRAGNALQGVAKVEQTMVANGKYAIVVESGKFCNVSGDYKGYVIVEGVSADTKVGAIELP